MKKDQSLTEQRQKLFEVTYCVEQGYAIRIEASSPEEAEHIIEQRLDDKDGVLDGSTRVHHDHFVNTVEQLAIIRPDRTGARHCPDCTNLDRARCAEKAIRTFSRETGSELGRDALHDLLCDLGHYADELGLDFEAEVSRALDTWDEEKAERTVIDETDSTAIASRIDDVLRKAKGGAA